MIKLVCMDMDGVLVEPNNIWMELHAKYGTLEEGKILTEKYLRTDYERLVQEVIGRLWKGKPAQPYYELVESIPFMQGIEEFFAALGTTPRVIISGGSYHLAEKIQKQFGIDKIFANRIIIEQERINGRGEFHWPVGAGYEVKATIVHQVCREFGVSPDEVLYIGDSGADIDAFRIVGVSIAFNSKSQELKDAATHVVQSADLLDVVPLIQAALRG